VEPSKGRDQGDWVAVDCRKDRNKAMSLSNSSSTAGISLEPTVVYHRIRRRVCHPEQSNRISLRRQKFNESEGSNIILQREWRSEPDLDTAVIRYLGRQERSAMLES